MKKLFLALFLALISLWSLSHGGEMTGAGRAIEVMRENNINFQELQRQGHNLLLGEFTGAGAAVKLDKIKIYLTDKELYFKEEVDHVEFDPEARAFPAGDFRKVKYLEINGRAIPKQAIKALVIK